MIVALNKSSKEMKNKVKKGSMFIYTRGFKNYDISPEEFYKEVAIEGYPFCIAEMVEDEFKFCHKITTNFKSCQVIALDIDNENLDNYWSYEDAVNDPFVIKNALFIYTTPSNTQEKNRFRIVFHLPKIHTDSDEVKNFNKSLNFRFDGDTATTCCVQSFFGSANSTSHFFGNTFDKEDLEKMVAEYEFEESVERKEIESSDIKNAKLTLDDIILILDYYFKDGKVDNYKWFLAVTILSAYCGLTPDVIKELLSKYFDELGDIDEKIKHADKYLKGKTIASLIYLAQQNGYQIPDHIDEQRKDYIFWTIEEYGPEDDRKLRCNLFYSEALIFAKRNNFHIYSRNGIRQLVRIEGNVISQVKESEFHEYLRAFIDRVELNNKHLALEKFDRFAKQMIPAVLASLPDGSKIIEEKIILDKKDKAFLFFENGFLEISSDIKFLDYSQLNGLIWKSSQLQHNFEINDNTKGDFEDYIDKIATNREGSMLIINQGKVKSLKTSIGYLLHKFKDPSKVECILLTDEVLSSAPQGGTGKSLFQQALSKVINTVVINGIDFQNNKNYTYEEVDMETRLINIDDCMRNFDFEELFSILVGSLTVRKKYVSQVTIPFEHSPKFCLSSNRIIKGSGESHDRRKFEIEFSNYFSTKHTPSDEYKTLFFVEWDEKEWNRFFTFMGRCILYYLKEGKILKYTATNLAEKKVKCSLGESLFEFFETYIVEDNFYTSKLLLEEYREMSNDDISPTKLTQSLKKYAEFKGLSLVDEYDKKLKSKVYILTNQNVKTLSEMKKKVSYEDNLNIL